MSQFPFTAVVGMDQMRLALALNAVSPEIGGVLARGEKGTAKSTTVRALAAVLPPVTVVVGCRFSCDPARPDAECPDGPHPVGVASTTRPAALRELPVGATEDRLTGSLDLEKALTEGISTYTPGLLAGAHRGVLYVDEVNLLHDHLVDLLLDAAALGTSYVERDGVSVRHAARFLLVGTMNPEEGELRPQLLDRFGLTVEVAAPREAPLRAEVVRRRLAFDADPVAFTARFADDEQALATRIADARALLPDVVLDDPTLERIATVCASFDVDGLRADIVTARTAAAHAAWHGRTDVTTEDVRVAATLALPHRRRRNPFDAPGLDPQQLEDALDDTEPDPGPESPPDPPGGGAPDPDGPRPDGSAEPSGGSGNDGTDEQPAPAGDGVGPDPTDESVDAPGPDPADVEDGPGPAPSVAAPVAAPTEPRQVRRLEVPGVGEGTPGRRSRARTATGRVTGSERPTGRLTSLHLTSTLLAAAPHQQARGRTGPGLHLVRDDLRAARREGRESNLVLFVVDASGSMAARTRMGQVKGAVLSLLLDAYQRRDKVGMITFSGAGAQLVLPATSSVEAAAARLTELPTGGRTPLADGLLLAHETLARERLRDPSRRPLLVVVTDGRVTTGGSPAPAAGLLRERGVAALVLDCEAGRVRLGLAAELAVQLGAQVLPLAELTGEQSIASTVRGMREAA